MAVAAAGPAAAAPRFVCYPVAAGDSVTALSVRLTRSSRSWREAGFQILDPASAKFIPKAQYRRIHPGWQACVVETLLARGVARPPYQDAAPARRPVVVSPGSMAPMGWWSLMTLCSGAIAALLLIQMQAEREAAIGRALRTFGAAFVREFERP
ncbi:MAG: hypothetical protein EHM55_25860, partial [Acidobacteria bacterium]